MKKISKFGEDFLLLALRINKHIKGYVDFYYGPEKLSQIVDNEAISSPSKLLIDSDNLSNKLGSQGYDIKREQYLEKMLTAMRTSIELLNRIEISIEDQFLKLYDVALQPANESELKNLKEEYYEAYGEPGSLEDRIEELRIKRRVPEEKVFKFFKRALEITEKRTKELFINLLPENEQILLDLTQEKNNNKIKWACYEWYLGNYNSRIEVNPKFGMYWTVLLMHSAHEGYPGHHTEFSVKESMLYRELNQFEHSILLLNSPKLLISEGIADLALNVLFSYRDQAEIGLNEFCPDVSKEDSIETMIAQNKVRHKLTLFWYNFAYHALIDNYTDEELFSYGKNFEIFGEDDLRNQIKRLNDPVYSKNAFTYNLGMNIIKKKYGEFPSVKDFRNLLVNPILPCDLL
ncbi:MAG TPA: hypothetical protein VMV43_09145 [Candidatus Nanopelagicaceae bacterium]|nr:hypothetical protein [Candidatus Nanopelagicaceae bacterium]